MNKENCYYLGTITRKHGLQGAVVLKLDTDQPEDYNRLENIFLDINGLLAPFFVDKQQWHKGDSKIISFRNSSEALVEQAVGRDVYLPLESLPPLSGNQFYYHEVSGFEILDINGTSYGKIKAVNDMTAQHYFILVREGKEVIIPIIRDWIREVNRATSQIIMELPEGLLEVFTNPGKNDEV